MQKICFFKDYLCAIRQERKLDILRSNEVEVVRKLKVGDIDEELYGPSLRDYERGYGQMVNRIDQTFGISAPSFLYSILLNRDKRWMDTFLSSLEVLLYNSAFSPELYLARIRVWALHPSNWYLIDSKKSAYQLEMEISESFPCLVFENIRIESASLSKPDVELRNAEQILQATDVYELWNRKVFGQSNKVTILDTGISQDVASKINAKSDAIDGLSANDLDGHGSTVAEMINLISPQCEIHSRKIMDSASGGEAFDIFAGLHDFNQKKGHVVCMPLTIPDGYLRSQRAGGASMKQMIHGIFESLSNNKNFAVCASGNTGVSNLLWPSACRYALSVGSHNLTRKVSSFSNHDVNALNFILAPGGDFNKSNFTSESYGRYGIGLKQDIYGTSFSAAVTAGVSSLLCHYDWFDNMTIPSRISLFKNHCKKNLEGYPVLSVADIGAVWPL